MRLKTPKKYKGKAFDIPFAVVQNGTTLYKVKMSVAASQANFDKPAVIEQAVDRYITHYFPEFYAALGGNIAELTSINQLPDLDEAYNTLRSQLISNTIIETQYATSPPSAKDIFVCKLTYNIFEKRDSLVSEDRMPSFEAALVHFNQANGLEQTESQTEFPVVKLSPITQSLQEVFNKFGKQQNRTPGPQLPVPLEFGFLGISVSKVLSSFTEDLTAAVKGAGRSYKFKEGDTLTFYFGRIEEDTTGKLFVVPKYGITDIKYLAADKSLSAEHLKIGHFSMVKYSQALKDPVTSATLKNYSSLLETARQKGRQGSAFSLESFFGSALGMDFAGGFPQAWNASPNADTVQDDENNALINKAVDLGIIDIADTASLQVSIGAYTSEQLMALNNAVTNDPALYASVFVGQQKKMEQISPDVFGKIEDMLLEGPMAGISDDSPIGAFMRHFGIKSLVKEALLCLTFGMNFEVARIVAIVDEIKGMIESGNIVVEFGGSVKGVTKPQIPIPSIGDLAEMFPMFTITGDIWKMILDIVIESLQDALIQIIAQLAELLRELCDFNNPRSRDYGDTNIGDLVPTPRNPDMTAAAGPYDPFQGTNLGDTGMTPDDIMDYLGDVSTILSSLDICILLTNPAGASDELMQKILDYNTAYVSNPLIQTTLSTFSEIIGFFAQLARIVDVTDLCNEIANEVGAVNQDNICLTEDDIQSVNLDDMDNIETLLDILQNGLQPEVFTPNFDCPDNPNYVRDPTFKKSIYETLNALVEIVELQFSYSTESIKSVMMDSRLQGSTGAAANALAGANVDQPEDWPPPPDAVMITLLKNILEGFENVQSYQGQLQACINDNQDLLQLDLNLADIGAVIEKVMEGMEIAFAANGGLRDILDALDDAESAAISGQTLVSRKVFKQRFLREFRDYVQLSDVSEDATANDFIREVNPNMGTDFDEVPDVFNIPAGSVNPENATDNITGEYVPGGREVIRWYFRTQTPRPGLLSMPPETRARYSQAAIDRFGTDDDGQIIFAYPPYGSNQFGLYSFSLSALFQQVPGAYPALQEELASLSNVNITLDPVVDTVRNTIIGNTAVPGNNGATISVFDHDSINEYAAKRIVPLANGLLTDYLFDYYIENGIFDAATLQSLSFFHDNENCAPGDTSDLLDVDGIIDEMLNMFEKIACYSDLPARKKVRMALKYGMYLLFVQIHIAEFIIKNIFVFSAAGLDELFSKNFILLYMRNQIENSTSQYLDTINEATRGTFTNDLVELFQIINKMEGGLVDFQGNVVFQSGEELPINRQTYDKIISYLIGQRTINSRSSVNNAIKQSHPNANPLPLEEIFLRSIPAYETHKDNWINPQKEQFFLFPLLRPNSVIADDFGPQSGAPGVPLTPPRPRLFVVKEYHPKADLNGTSELIAEIPENESELQIEGESFTGEDLPAAPVEYIVRYQFWLTYQDSDIQSSDLGSLRVYPLLPASRNSYPVTAVNSQALAYQAQDRSFDREISIPADDPRLQGLPGKDENGFDSFANPLTWGSATLTADDVEFLLSVPEYQEYFTNVFNKDLLSMVPLIQNFYLTTKYFDEIGSAMKSTKDACLSIINEAIASDDRYDSTPDMSRSASSAFTNTLPEGNPFEPMMRDFIILMLIKTPIDILKGILELIDPHVAISKFIKNITGKLFNVMSQIFDDIIDTAEPLQELGIDSGEKLLAIVLCFMDVLMKNPPGSEFPEGLQTEMEAFFPRITEEGIDFLGSVMGLFMIPPTPLGILYLLLSLINVEIPSFGADTGDNALVDANTESGPTEC